MSSFACGAARGPSGCVLQPGRVLPGLSCRSRLSVAQSRSLSLLKRDVRSVPRRSCFTITLRPPRVQPAAHRPRNLHTISPTGARAAAPRSTCCIFPFFPPYSRSLGASCPSPSTKVCFKPLFPSPTHRLTYWRPDFFVVSYSDLHLQSATFRRAKMRRRDRPTRTTTSRLHLHVFKTYAQPRRCAL